METTTMALFVLAPSLSLEDYTLLVVLTFLTTTCLYQFLNFISKAFLWQTFRLPLGSF